MNAYIEIILNNVRAQVATATEYLGDKHPVTLTLAHSVAMIEANAGAAPAPITTKVQDALRQTPHTIAVGGVGVGEAYVAEFDDEDGYDNAVDEETAEFIENQNVGAEVSESGFVGSVANDGGEGEIGDVEAFMARVEQVGAADEDEEEIAGDTFHVKYTLHGDDAELTVGMVHEINAAGASDMRKYLGIDEVLNIVDGDAPNEKIAVYAVDEEAKTLIRAILRGSAGYGGTLTFPGIGTVTSRGDAQYAGIL